MGGAEVGPWRGLSRWAGRHATSVADVQQRRGTQWEAAAAREVPFAAAEQERLLSVAATRARNPLVISRYEKAEADDPWAPLADRLGPLPELQPLGEAPAGRPPLQGPPDVAAALQARIRAAGAEGFRRRAVTEAAHDADAEGEGPPPAPAAGWGPSSGTAVHRVLAQVFRGLAAERWMACARAP